MRGSLPDLETLENLLLEVFSVDELRRWLVTKIEPTLRDDWPAERTPAATVFEVAALLVRRGLLNKRFFEELVRARPHIEARVGLLLSTWSGETPFYVMRGYQSSEHDGKNTIYIRDAVVPPDCFVFEVPTGKQHSSDAFIVRKATVGTVFELLSLLYENLLSDRVAPFSYGDQWLLATGKRGGSEVLVPLVWLQTRSREGLADWLLSYNMDSFHESFGRSVVLTTPQATDVRAFAVLSSSREVHDAFRSGHIKARAYLSRTLFEPITVQAAIESIAPFSSVFLEDEWRPQTHLRQVRDAEDVDALGRLFLGRR